MTKQATEKKIRISGVMEPSLISKINKEADYEGRSFSDMVGRLCSEAIAARIKPKKKSA